MIALAALIRHPIKSVGYERIAAASLTVGRALPFDREWAVAHEAAKFGPDHAEWAAKMNFLRGVAGPELMAVRAESDVAARRVTLIHPRAGRLTVAPDQDPESLIDWLRPIWPEGRPAPSFVVQVPGQAMTDVPQPYISVLNSASNRALGEKLGTDLSIHRWRGNLWFEGLAPFGEFDLLGKTLRIGDAELRVEQRITRCRATCVNPETGADDVDTLAALKTHWGHQDFGVYALVTKAGEIGEGDKVTLL